MAQKTLLQIAQQLAPEIDIPAPQAVISSQDLNVQKLRALISATCDDLLNEYDWQALQKSSSFTTIPGQESYPFPSDIKRYISGTFFSNSTRWELEGPLTASSWEYLKVRNIAASPYTKYRIYGGLLHLMPTPGDTPTTFVFDYISNSYVRTTGGATASDFTQDSDVCLFDHRLVIYGTKKKWLESFNFDTTAATTDYIRALEFTKSQDTPSAPLSILGGRCSAPLLSSANIPDFGLGA